MDSTEAVKETLTLQPPSRMPASVELSIKLVVGLPLQPIRGDHLIGRVQCQRYPLYPQQAECTSSQTYY